MKHLSMLIANHTPFVRRNLRFKIALARAFRQKNKSTQLAQSFVAHEERIADQLYWRLDIPLFSNIFKWLIDNWDTVLRVMITVITVLDGHMVSRL